MLWVQSSAGSYLWLSKIDISCSFAWHSALRRQYRTRCTTVSNVTSGSMTSICPGRYTAMRRLQRHYDRVSSYHRNSQTPSKHDWNQVMLNIHSNYKYSRLSLSRIPKDSLKHFEISVLRHISIERVRKTINWTTTFNKWICNLTPEVRNMYIK